MLPPRTADSISQANQIVIRHCLKLHVPGEAVFALTGSSVEYVAGWKAWGLLRLWMGNLRDSIFSLRPHLPDFPTIPTRLDSMSDAGHAGQSPPAAPAQTCARA